MIEILVFNDGGNFKFLSVNTASYISFQDKLASIIYWPQSLSQLYVTYAKSV